MTPKLTITLLRALFVVFTTYIGVSVGETIFGRMWIGVLAGAAFGLSLVLLDRVLKGISLRVFSSATFGLLMGAIFAKLLLASNILRNTPEELQWLSSLLVYAASAYFGAMLAIRSNREDFSLIIPYVQFQRTAVQDAPLIIDSNIIIDGRITELCLTGFVSRSLVVPQFILHELQRLADSADQGKRERGRRALERLQTMQRDPQISVAIHEAEGDADLATDTKLVQLAKVLNARLLTNDSNLGALARLQGVTVLTLHELSRALRPALATGDELDLALTKEGRDAHQALGYLPDGTMIVVNHARPQLGKTVRVVVASVVQTASGRIYFGELR